MNKSEFRTSSGNKLVIVTQRVDVISDRDERRDSLDQSMIEWLTQAGYTAVVIPNVLIGTSGGAATKKIDSWLKAINPSALLLSGGNDIGECIERDNTECYLLAWAKTGSIPVLGICRGL